MSALMGAEPARYTSARFSQRLSTRCAAYCAITTYILEARNQAAVADTEVLRLRNAWDLLTEWLRNR